jgi:long-chain acyl-CoA synthetase
VTEPTPGMVEFWARQKPDAVAIVDGEARLTWKQWNDEANRLAHGLKARGIKAGDIVVTRLQIRKEWPIISSALGKLGCRVLGLNWRLTTPETQYVLSNSGAAAIICDDPTPKALLPAFDGLNLKLAASVDAAARGFVSYADLIAKDGEPLFATGTPPLIIYTSGTTGLPKGVVMGVPAGGEAAMREMMEYLRSVGESRPQVSGDVMLVTMPMHHGAGPSIVWGAMRQGNLQVMLRRFDPEQVLQLIDQYKVTFWTGVPTMFKRIAGLPAEVIARYDLSSVRALGVGAAPVPFSLKEWIVEHFGPVLSEGYGSTEVGMITALAPEMQLKKPGSSGLPHRHVSISIRDEQGRELAAGESGEIWVKTPAVIRQYLNGKPLGTDTLDEKGFFRTGDVGRLDADGYLFITDRAKDMIVSGGVNIYPAEIEAAIIRHPAIQDVAVIGIPDDEFGEQVKAFVELKPGRVTDEASILNHCRETLASYKRPRSIDIVSELPRNTMGKLLKRELREPFWKDRERKV